MLMDECLTSIEFVEWHRRLCWKLAKSFAWVLFMQRCFKRVLDHSVFASLGAYGPQFFERLDGVWAQLSSGGRLGEFSIAKIAQVID